MQNHIFKVSNICGKTPAELSVQDSYDIARAAVTWFASQTSNLQRIAVALDGRLYGHEMYQQVARAIVDAGFQVYFLGVCPTPVFVFGLHQLPVQAGIMITASEKSSEFNGFKIFLNNKLVQGSDLVQIYEILEQRNFLKLHDIGKIIPCPIMDQYVDSLWQEFAHLSEYDFSMIVDCGNGATGPVMKKLIHRMGWKQAQLLCEEVDGNFPIHAPNPFDVKNLSYLKSELKNTKKQIGIAFDGDGGSMIVMDHCNKLALTEQLVAMFAQDILTKNAHRVIVFDIVSEKLSALITQAHGQSLIVASCLKTISEAVILYSAIFAAQMNGQFFFKDRHAGCYSDGIYSMLRMLDVLVKNRITLTQMLQQIDDQLKFASIKLDMPESIKEL